MHVCRLKFELQTYKAALPRNLPREITVILKKSTALNRTDVHFLDYLQCLTSSFKKNPFSRFLLRTHGLSQIYTNTHKNFFLHYRERARRRRRHPQNLRRERAPRAALWTSETSSGDRLLGGVCKTTLLPHRLVVHIDRCSVRLTRVDSRALKHRLVLYWTIKRFVPLWIDAGLGLFHISDWISRVPKLKLNEWKHK